MNSVLDFSPPHLLFPQIHTNTPTHKTYLHRKIITKIPKHTHTDKPTERQISVGVGHLWIGGLVLVALDQSSWVDGNGSKCLWIDVGGKDQCLWVNGNGFWCLWIDASGEDRCLWVDRFCACGFWFLWFLWGLVLVVLVVEIGACGG